MKIENARKFHKPAKIFAGVAKFCNPCEKIPQPPAKFRSPLRNFAESTPEFYAKLQSTITFSSELRFTRF